MWDANLDMCAVTGRSSRKSMASNSRNSNVQAKVSAWRDPKDKPQRQSTNAQAATPARAGPQYEGPDQQLAEQLERWAQWYSARHISIQLHWLNKIACIEFGIGCTPGELYILQRQVEITTWARWKQYWGLLQESWRLTMAGPLCCFPMPFSNTCGREHACRSLAVSSAVHRHK